MGVGIGYVAGAMTPKKSRPSTPDICTNTQYYDKVYDEVTSTMIVLREITCNLPLKVIMDEHVLKCF
jgi:hypothetical protein